MPRLLRLAGRHGRLEDDRCVYLDLDPHAIANGAAAASFHVLPWPRWQREAAADPLCVGAWVEGDQEPEPLLPELERTPLLAIRFGAMNDGRGLSLAVLLRTRHGYRGELRAVGDIHRDQLCYLSRVGFDAFLLREGEDADGALAALGGFSEAYQASVDRPQPLFRRRG